MIVNEYYEKQSIKNNETKELDKLKSQKSDLSTEIANLEKEYREMNSQITQRQNELKLEEIKYRSIKRWTNKSGYLLIGEVKWQYELLARP